LRYFIDRNAKISNREVLKIVSSKVFADFFKKMWIKNPTDWPIGLFSKLVLHLN